MLIGKMYEARKKSVGAPKGNTNAEKQSHQNGDIVGTRTKDVIAKELGIGGTTVERAEKFSEGVDAIKDESPEAGHGAKRRQGRSQLRRASFD